ncbi:MAG: hypothetical protein CMO36_09540 [Verrucomicrobiaceae bacterium]|nr:hypothetical protein [Verrucomicrobiaceae bacterium]
MTSKFNSKGLSKGPNKPLKEVIYQSYGRFNSKCRKSGRSIKKFLIILGILGYFFKYATNFLNFPKEGRKVAKNFVSFKKNS